MLALGVEVFKCYRGWHMIEDFRPNSVNAHRTTRTFLSILSADGICVTRIFVLQVF